jgi:3-oxoacyl-[acyl-carrier-protein] synthase-1
VITHEVNGFAASEPNRADGLTSAFRELRSGISPRRADVVLSCQTGESFWAKEFVKAYLRNSTIMPEPLVASLPASSFGELGAPAGAVATGLAMHRMNGVSRPIRALLYGSADSGTVGACMIESNPN